MVTDCGSARALSLEGFEELFIGGAFLILQIAIPLALLIVRWMQYRETAKPNRLLSLFQSEHH